MGAGKLSNFFEVIARVEINATHEAFDAAPQAVRAAPEMAQQLAFKIHPHREVMDAVVPDVATAQAGRLHIRSSPSPMATESKAATSRKRSRQLKAAK